MKRLIRAIAILATLAALAVPAEAGDRLRIGVEGAYPPFNLLDKDGKLQGFDIDIANALCAEMKTECVFVTQDWDTIIPGLLAGKYDAVVSSMSDTPARRKSVLFTDKYYSNLLRFVAVKGSRLVPTSAGLKGKAIGAQRTTVAAQYAKKHFKNSEVRLYDTQGNAWLDLASGRIDVVLADMLAAYDWLKTPRGAANAFLGEGIDIGDRIAIAVRKSDGGLAKRLNAAIAAIRTDGTYQKINAQYFPFSIY